MGKPLVFDLRDVASSLMHHLRECFAKACPALPDLWDMVLDRRVKRPENFMKLPRKVPVTEAEVDEKPVKKNPAKGAAGGADAPPGTDGAAVAAGPSAAVRRQGTVDPEDLQYDGDEYAELSRWPMHRVRAMTVVFITTAFVVEDELADRFLLFRVVDE